MKENKKPKRDVLVSHKDKIKEITIKPHGRNANYRGDIKENKNKPGISMSIKIED